jgi:2-phospho-L-lactate guanylyltransferase
VLPDDGRWFLVVPVKRLEVAKTRLGPPYDGARRDLARCFALDTVAAALSSPLVRAVAVVTDDASVAGAMRDLGAEVVPDEPDAGLNPALSHGAEVAAARHPGCGAGALSSDLPALRPAELTAALARAAEHAASFVRDADGHGTTLVTARAPTALRPLFGPDSARRHASSGHHEVTGGGLDSLRRDVDTADDLAAALALGVGPRTTGALRRLG